MDILRNIGAVLLGSLAGGVVNMALIVLNTKALYPMPAGLDPNDPAQFNAWIAGLPAAAFVLPLVAHLAHAFVGAIVAVKLAASRHRTLAMVVGGLTLLAGIMNAMAIHIPTWMYVEFPLYLVVAWLGGRLVAPRTAA